MRKLIIVAVALSLAFITGCSFGDENSKNSGDGNVSLKVAGQNNEDHPNTIALEEMVETVSDKTDGRVEMDIYPANQLGDYSVVYEELGKGTIDMGLISAPTHMDSRLEMNVLPFLFTNYDEVRENYTLDSFFGETLQAVHNDQGIQLLGFFAEGFGGIATTKEVTDQMDYGADKNVLLRVPDVKVLSNNVKEMGFNTVSVSYEELYTALQSGTAEGWTGGHAPVNYLQFRDVITHYYQYNDIFEATHLLMNKDIFEDISEEDRQVIEEASDKLTNDSFDMAEDNEEEYREKMEEEGIEVFEFEDSELEDLAEKTKENVWPDAEESLGKELLDELLEEVQ